MHLIKGIVPAVGRVWLDQHYFFSNLDETFVNALVCFIVTMALERKPLY